MEAHYTDKSTAPHMTLPDGRKVYVCTQAGITDASALAAALWGSSAVIGFPGERPGARADGRSHVGYVAAHRTGPVMPVYASE